VTVTTYLPCALSRRQEVPLAKEWLHLFRVHNRASGSHLEVARAVAEALGLEGEVIPHMSARGKVLEYGIARSENRG
jgi:hypothetical protein